MILVSMQPDATIYILILMTQFYIYDQVKKAIASEYTKPFCFNMPCHGASA